MKKIELTPFEGHIVLYCKNHYGVKDVSLINGFQRIWAVRCGYGIEAIDKGSLEYIANFLFELLIKTNPKIEVTHFQKRLHKELSKWYLDSHKELSTIEQIIWFYRNEIVGLQIRENGKMLMTLPTAKKRLFKRIISGKFEYNDYKLIN